MERTTRELDRLYHDNALLAGQVTEARDLALQFYRAILEFTSVTDIDEIIPEFARTTLPDWLLDEERMPDWNDWPDDDA